MVTACCEAGHDLLAGSFQSGSYGVTFSLGSLRRFHPPPLAGRPHTSPTCPVIAFGSMRLTENPGNSATLLRRSAGTCRWGMLPATQSRRPCQVFRWIVLREVQSVNHEYGALIFRKRMKLITALLVPPLGIAEEGAQHLQERGVPGQLAQRFPHLRVVPVAFHVHVEDVLKGAVLGRA